MRISLLEFTTQEKGKQLETLWDYGTLIDFRETADAYCSLYWLCCFYVELQYQMNKEDMYVIKCSVTDEMLEPYLEKIDISELLEDL